MHDQGMHDYVIEIAVGETRLAPNGQGPTFSPQGAGWRPSHQGLRVRIWERSADSSSLKGSGAGALYIIGRACGTPRDPSSLIGDSWGAYVAVHEARGSGEVTVLRDPSGRVPAFHIQAGERLLVTSRLDAIGSDLESDIDFEYLRFHLINNYLHARATAWTRLHELLPGEALRVRAGRVETIVMWNPGRLVAQSFSNGAEARAAFRDAAERATAFWGEAHGRVTLDLSGGLDSSVMAGLLARLKRKPAVTAINFITESVESDERLYARDAARLHGVPLVERAVDAAAVDYRRAFIPLLARPSVTLLPLAYDEVAIEIACAAGATAFFTGRGGDHMFFDRAPIASLHDYATLAGDAWGVPRQAYRYARLSGRTFWAGLKAAWGAQAPQRAVEALLVGGNDFATQECRAYESSDRYVHPWFADADALPAGKIQHLAHLVEMQRHYSRFGRADLFEEAHPFMSQPVLEAALRTPSYLFYSRDAERALQRECFADLLAPSMQKRRGKGATTGHSLRSIRNNLSFVRPFLLDGRLVARGLLCRAALERGLTEDALAHGRSLPALINCITTEFWLERAERFLSGHTSRRL